MKLLPALFVIISGLQNKHRASILLVHGTVPVLTYRLVAGQPESEALCPRHEGRAPINFQVVAVDRMVELDRIVSQREHKALRFCSKLLEIIAVLGDFHEQAERSLMSLFSCCPPKDVGEFTHMRVTEPPVQVSEFHLCEVAGLLR